MIRVMTLDIGGGTAQALKPDKHPIGSLSRETVDVLCCQSVPRPLNSGRDCLAAHLDRAGLQYSCFAANRPSVPQSGTRRGELTGLAIMTGPRIWMLNSGSFPLPGADGLGEGIVQFAHVRQGFHSLLVLNVQMAPARRDQLAQMRGLFASQLLQERYGAVVLCAGGLLTLTATDWLKVTAKSPFMPYHGAAALDGDAAATLAFAPRGQDFTISAAPYAPLPTAGEKRLPPRIISQPGSAIAVEITRQAPRQRLLLPLSFREQWLGSKENFRAFAY